MDIAKKLVEISEMAKNFYLKLEIRDTARHTRFGLYYGDFFLADFPVTERGISDAEWCLLGWKWCLQNIETKYLWGNKQ